MPDTFTLHVRAKPPLVLPRMGRPGFVGYETAPTSADVAETDHVVPDGLRYRLKADPESVPNNSYYRRAIARGDIMDADAPEPAEQTSPEGGEPPAVEPPPVDEGAPSTEEPPVVEEPPTDTQPVLEEPPAEPEAQPEPEQQQAEEPPPAEPTEPAPEPTEPAAPEPEQTP